jgi:mannosyltransferase OCH1-like enzyme
VSIPKRLHIVWIGPRPFPHQSYLDAWRAMHTDWQLVLWTDELLEDEALICQPIVDQIGHMAGKVNLIRLELLARYGGVYVDADTEPLKPLDTLPVPDWADSWAMTSRNNFVQNAVMAAVPDHPILTDLVAKAPAEWQRLRGRRVQFTEVFGAHYITKPLRAHKGFWEPDRNTGWKRRKVFRDRAEGEPGDAWAIHDCDRSWQRELGGSRVRL